MKDHAMRRATVLLSTLVFALTCAGCASVPADASGNPELKLHGHRIEVEIAADDATREHGLMDRTSMPAGHGMLFVFPDSQVRTFWMKNTLIPLDMLFFDADRKLVTLLANVPPCKADPCPVYPSTAPARYVLELNAGAAAKLGVHEGDVAKFIGVPSTAQ